MIYDEPRFLPGGDRFVLVELGNEMTLESRLFYFPTAYLDPWSAEATDR